MVYTGKPSTGCRTCRQRKIKVGSNCRLKVDCEVLTHLCQCDEGKPACLRCMKSKRECLGYRNGVQIQFRNETEKIQARSLASGTVKGTASASSGFVPAANSKAAFNTIANLTTRDAAQEALCYFFVNFIATPRHIASGEGPLHLLPHIYFKARTESPLFPITAAVALIFLSRQRRSSELKQEAERSWSDAIVRLRHAIADPITAKQNDTLLTMHLCGTWDAFRHDIKSLATWGQHAQGSWAVAKLRGAEMQENPVSKQLLRNLLREHIQTKTLQRLPIEISFEDTFGPDCLPQEGPPGQRLTAIASKIADLRARGKLLLQTEMTARLAGAMTKLYQDAKGVEQELIEWQVTLPQSWNYFEIQRSDYAVDETESLDDQYYPGPVYSYYDLWIASTYNTWRTHRIFVRVLMLNCLERLLDPQKQTSSVEYQSTVCILQKLVDGVCFTLPFQQGLEPPISRYAESVCPPMVADFSDPTGQRTLIRPDMETHRKMAENFAGFTTYLPLIAAHGVPCAPEQQRRWIKRRYMETAERCHLSIMAAVGQNFMSDDYSKRVISAVDYAPPPFTSWSVGNLATVADLVLRQNNATKRAPVDDPVFEG